LQDSHRDRKSLGHGQGYLYPHDFPGHFVPQEYLPEELAGARFYEAGQEGVEPDLVARWQAFRKRGEEPPGSHEPRKE
jgi:putative ATPase